VPSHDKPARAPEQPPEGTIDVDEALIDDEHPKDTIQGHDEPREPEAGKESQEGSN
jgi:hypothetical protein